jgi:hypothetical protein
VTLDNFDEIELRLTQMAYTQMVPVNLLHPEARIDLDVIGNRAIILFRGDLVTSDSRVQRSTFDYTEHLKPWWIPGFIWRRIPTRKATCILETKYASTHPYADIPEFKERLGPVAIKTIKNSWVDRPA